MMEGVELHENDSMSQIKAGRAHFSKIGQLYFVGTLVIFAVKIIFSSIISQGSLVWLRNSGIFLFVNTLPTYLLSMPLMIVIVSRMKVDKVIKTEKMSVGQMIQALLISIAMVYVSNLVGEMLTRGIGQLKGSPVQNKLVEIISSENSWSVFVATVIMAPMYEELIFRKLLIDRVSPYGEGVAVLLSGLVFGVFHGNISQFAYAFPLGVFWGFIYVKTRRLRYTVILHMMANFVGGVVSLWVSKRVNLQELETFLSNPSVAVGVSENLILGLIIILIYYVVLMVVIISGIILLLVHRDKFKFSRGSLTIPKGGRFKAVIVNPGMLLFLGFWITQIFIQILS